VLLTESRGCRASTAKKMSKSYGNTIRMREEPNVIEQKIKTWKTDPRACGGPIPAGRGVSGLYVARNLFE
jgi:tryptophanyl-tRNA synthetase